MQRDNEPIHLGLSRRAMLRGGTALGAAGALSGVAAAAQKEPVAAAFRYCLNTSTISMTASGQRRPLPEMIDIAARAGYQGIEPWFRDIDPYVAGGGTVKDLAQRIRDRGLVVESAIAFPEWLVDDDARRAKGFDETKRCMEI